MAKAKKAAPKGRGTPSEYERHLIAKGNKRKLDVIPMEADLVENVTPAAGAPSSRATQASAAKDFKAMMTREGDPFASKRRQIDVGPYKPTAKDIKKGVVQDPKVFKGDDAPYAAASRQQQELFRKADAQVKASSAVGDRDGADKAKRQMNVLGQFPGASGGVSHACFGSNCSNEVKPSESVLCPTCESRDSREVQIGSPSTSAISRATVRTKKSA
jgi:hypothetical protein